MMNVIWKGDNHISLNQDMVVQAIQMLMDNSMTYSNKITVDRIELMDGDDIHWTIKVHIEETPEEEPKK